MLSPNLWLPSRDGRRSCRTHHGCLRRADIRLGLLAGAETTQTPRGSCRVLVGDRPGRFRRRRLRRRRIVGGLRRRRARWPWRLRRRRVWWWMWRRWWQLTGAGARQSQVVHYSIFLLTRRLRSDYERDSDRSSDRRFHRDCHRVDGLARSSPAYTPGTRLRRRVHAGRGRRRFRAPILSN